MRQNILSILLLAVIIGVGFYWRQYLGQPAVTPTAGRIQVESAKLRQYRQLKNLKLDSSLYSDPLFQSLQRVGAAASATSSIPHGRDNPFVAF